jgi:hypothetical protein
MEDQLVRGISGESLMQLSTERIDTADGDEENTLKLHVMLVHEDLSAGRRGKEVLDQVALNLKPKASFLVNLWNFEVLRNPALQGQAVQDAAHADIVVLSAHGRAKLPAAVRAWLEVWLDRRGDSPCALVVSLDASIRESNEANPMMKYVNALAWQAGVEVFSHFGATP